MTTRRTMPLLELDPDLGQLIPAERRSAALAQLQVEVHRLAAGPWSTERVADANPEHVGLLLLDGVASREVVVADTVSTELLGPGDVLRPWALGDAQPLLQLSVRWNALTECSLAVLDRRFAARLAHWPEVNSVLIDRLNDRAQRLATNQAISQLNRVDRRLLALFWHLAERWGRVTSQGVAVPLTLSHRMLGQLVGARRPTVSTAIGDLAKREELVRRADGTWLLKADPVGLPAPETERVVPIRRHLLGSERAGEPTLEDLTYGDPEGAGDSEAAAALEMTSTATAELRATLARLRSDSQARVDQLRGVSETTAALLQRTAELREQRDRARERRGPRGRRPNGARDASRRSSRA
jgi:CRP/FNR family transcriptional regulator, cyclic AMP receptor protein